MASKFGTWWQKLRFHSWWQKIQQHPFVTMGIILLIALIIAVVLSNGTGFNEYTVKSTVTETTLSPQTKVTITAQSQPGKTLWDLLQLLVVPLILAIGGFWFNQIQKDREQRAINERAEREKRETEQRAKTEREATEQRAKTEREIAADNQREAALQNYIDKMSELLSHENLRKSRKGAEVRTIAHVRTLTVLQRLDAARKGNVLQFLYESGLLDIDKHFCILIGADLTGADLKEVSLEGADLDRANLHGADLSHADLRGTHLNLAMMDGANLKYASMSGIILNGAYLNEASLGPSVMNKAKLVLARMSEANLNNVILDDAFLCEAFLEGADLTKARLIRTNLSGANLKGANLEGANLTGAILGARPELRLTDGYTTCKVGMNGGIPGANLTGANLKDANLTGANLKGANLSAANLEGTIGITIKELEKQAASLKDATMTDGSRHS